MKTFQQQTAAAVSEPAETSLDKAVKSLNLSSEDKAFLYNLIDNAYKEYPGEKEYCRNYVWSKMKGHNKNSVFKVIKPYI